MTVDWRELRVHGVAGTPPKQLLQLAPLPSADWPLFGSRLMEVTEMPARHPERRALSWSSLTSGLKRHAVYLLLLPFMLVNVAGWTLGSLEVLAGQRPTATRWQLGLVRVAGLFLTVLFGAFLAVTVVDIAGRRVLASRWGDWIGLAASTACGLLIIGLLILTRVRPRRGRHPWRPADKRIDRAGTASLIVDQQALWNTPTCAAILHRAHAAALLATVTSLLWATLHRNPSCVEGWFADLVCGPASSSEVSWWLMWSVGFAGGSVLVGVVAVVWMSASPDGTLPGWLVWGTRWSIVVAVVGFVAAAAAWTASEVAREPTEWLVGVRATFVGSVAVLVVLTFVLRRFDSTRTPASLIVVAAGVAGVFGAGLGPALGAVLTRTRGGEPLDLPPSYGWLALTLTLTLAVLLVVATVAYARHYQQSVEQGNPLFVALRRLVRPSRGVVDLLGRVGLGGLLLLLGLLIGLWLTDHACFPPLGERWWWHRDLVPLDECLDKWAFLKARKGVVSWTIAGLPLVIISGSVWWWMLRGWQRLVGLIPLVLLAGATAWPWIPRLPALWLDDEAIVATLTLTLPAALLISQLRGAVGDRETRRGVAVLWDLATFWPRWFHPFAPPTYSDTAVTEIGQIIAAQTARRPVVLAPHSQGSIISMAAILLEQQKGTNLNCLALLTYGSPIGSHYRQMFPSMFSPAATSAVVSALGGPSETVRWRNLYRASDPVAGPIGAVTTPAGVVDAPCGDEGLPDLSPKGRAHSDYWLEPIWATTVTELRTRLAESGCKRSRVAAQLAQLTDIPFVWTPLDDSRPIEHSVLTFGDGPSVIVLHEVPGLSPNALDLALKLSAAGFRVHAPVLYGRPGDESMVVGAARAMWCLRRELNLFRRGARSPITDWLRALVTDVATVDHPKVGVVGMCMTGGLAIATLAEPAAGAAVAAQPSLPGRPPLPRIPGRADLGLDQETLDEAVDSGKPLLALRYERDWICPHQRFQTLEDHFGDGAARTVEQIAPTVTTRSWPRLRLIEIDGPGHATLTLDVTDEALAETISFLKANLGDG